MVKSYAIYNYNLVKVSINADDFTSCYFVVVAAFVLRAARFSEACLIFSRKRNMQMSPQNFEGFGDTG